ncbi:actin-like family protein, putative, partial [Eimeria tenella]
HAFGAGGGRWGPQSLDWRDLTRYKETQCYVSGSVVQPWSETFLIPEIFFSSQLLPDSNLAAIAPSMDHTSISELVLQCFRRSSVCEREGWLKRICLVGGTSQLPHFARRLEMDLLRSWRESAGAYYNVKDQIEVKVLPCEDRQLAAFRGALLFGLVARQEPEAWLSRSQFERTEGLEKTARQMALYS